MKDENGKEDFVGIYTYKNEGSRVNFWEKDNLRARNVMCLKNKQLTEASAEKHEI